MVGDGGPTEIPMIFLFYFVSRTSRSRNTGESPGRYKNFVTSGYPVELFVTEIRPVESCLGTKANFTW